MVCIPRMHKSFAACSAVIKGAIRRNSGQEVSRPLDRMASRLCGQGVLAQRVKGKKTGTSRSTVQP